MTLVELYSKNDCHLCDVARDTLEKAQKNYPFELREIKIAQGDNLFEEMNERIPVVYINKEFAFQQKVPEDQLIAKLKSLPGIDGRTRPRSFMVAKFLEAIGIAAVMIGLVQGLYGDMWGELYLFIGGIVAFVVGRRIEKRHEQHEAKSVNGTQ